MDASGCQYRTRHVGGRSSTSTTICASITAFGATDQDRSAAGGVGRQGAAARGASPPAAAQALHRHDAASAAHAMSGSPPGAAGPDRHPVYSASWSRRKARVHLPGTEGGHRAGLPASVHRPRQPLLPHTRGRRQGGQAGAPSRAPSERAFAAWSKNWHSGITTLGFIQERYLPDHNRRFATPPEFKDRRRPARPDRRHPLPPHRAHRRARQHRALRQTGRSPPGRSVLTTSGSTSTPTARSPCSTDPDASPDTRATSKLKPGRPRDPLRRDPPAACGQVDSRSAPDHFPTGPATSTEAANRCAMKTGQFYLLATAPPCLCTL